MKTTFAKPMAVILASVTPVQSFVTPICAPMARQPLRMTTGEGKETSQSPFNSFVSFFQDLQKVPVPSQQPGTGPKSKGVKDEDFDGVWVMMNGLPGNMGKEVAAACLRMGFRIAPYALTGPRIEYTSIMVDNQEGGPSTEVKLVRSDLVEDCDKAVAELRKLCRGGGEKLVVVDYTHPSAVNSNAEFYAKQGLNFVMGTTGGDREALMSVTENSGVYAVIAPNMGKQIVALQAAIDIISKEFPGSFSGYKLEITESHQSAKADTSGTAKALAEDFAMLTGEDYDLESIKKIRDREGQLAFGVPEEFLPGHAFHTYSLKSDDGTAEFQFRHNVGGRRMYAEGTADAVRFLAEKVAEGAEKKMYTMIDVLKMGGI